MEIDSLTHEAIESCLLCRLPFAWFALPGDTHFRFAASKPLSEDSSPAFRDERSDCFFINFFDNDEPYTAGVHFDMDKAEVIKYVDALIYDFNLPGWTPQISPRIPSTYRASYHEAFSAIVRRLKQEGGKTVLSRMRSIFSVKPVVEIASEYFDATDTTFRYLCYTPETGLWLGSTPELLLESDNKNEEVRTMALAGTRRLNERDCNGDAHEQGAEPSAALEKLWDSKNLTEHLLVRYYIADVLKDNGLEVTIGDLCEKRFINVAHLCTPISGKGPVDVRKLLSALSPTPAVAGFPPEIAKEDINRHETHRRYCYGGYVGVRTNGDYHAFVNLRCAFLQNASFKELHGVIANVYAGGGLMPESKEESEWQEAEAKSETLARILKGDDGVTGTEGRALSSSTVKMY